MPLTDEKVKPETTSAPPNPSRQRQSPMQWLRLWTSYLHSPKIQRVTEVSRARHINLLCIACECNQNGRLPSLDSMAWTLRLSAEAMQETIDELIGAGLIDEHADRRSKNVNAVKSYWIHDWGHWQFSVTPAAERQRRHRAKRDMSRDSHASVTPESRDAPVTDPRQSRDSDVIARARRAESETETEKKNPIPSNSISEPAGDATRVSGDVAGTVHETEAEQRARERAELNAGLHRRRNGPS